MMGSASEKLLPILTSSVSRPGESGGGTQEWSLVDWYLEQQGSLTAVERFSQVQTITTEAVYRALLPATFPKPGEQYAFEVDLDRCSGCKACVTACHSLNGLDDSETWREVGLLTGGTDQKPVLQHVTTACHHCLEPACMDVCPTLAYEKDAVTGIVRHLDDQCFGCQYCILACPYNVPKYNARLGIVRKCDLCSQRLAVGEAPACVQACPHEAIRIRTINREQVHSDCETSQFLPGTPDPQYTLPTTNYKTERALPRNLIPADYFRVQTEHAHGPLVTMLILTQLAVGGFVLLQATGVLFPKQIPNSWSAIQMAISLLFCHVALGASLMHLGRPWLAYRAILGLRTSWLSREILAFGVFAGLVTWLVGAEWLPQSVPLFGVGPKALLSAVSFWGLAGVFCSAMIYHRTKRPFWNVYQSGLRFGLTTLLLGLAVTRVSGAMTLALFEQDDAALPGLLSLVGRGVCLTAVLKGLFELGAFVPLSDRLQTPLKRSALLLIGPLRRKVLARFALLVVGGVLLTLLETAAQHEVFAPRQELVMATTSLFLLLGGELIERSLFFKASVAFRMPGGPSR